tara:strand:+ start:155 stop:640 length:486 start_codon:yes stop_codon:yes gene_type:complete
MPKYSQQSKTRLKTAHPDLQLLFNEVINHWDCTIIYGHRTPEEQFSLYRIGREVIAFGDPDKPKDWVIANRSEVVTHLDGYSKLSDHNKTPSLAVDAAPYPIDWNDLMRFHIFAGFVMGMANQMYCNGVIKNRVYSGLDWDKDWNFKEHSFHDAPHFFIEV